MRLFCKQLSFCTALFKIGLLACAVSAQEIPDNRYGNSSVQAFRRPAPKGMPYGFLSLSVFPGYKHIYLDQETVIGFSEKILVPAGSHWLHIIAPEGYADTTFEIIVSSGKTHTKTVKLRNENSNLFAAEMKSQKKGETKVWISVLKASCLTAGFITGIFAYQEELSASTAQRRYREAGPSADFYELYSDLDEHLQRRNILGAVSSAFLGVGIVLWFF
jgi:hypothetical protein